MSSERPPPKRAVWDPRLSSQVKSTGTTHPTPTPKHSHSHHSHHHHNNNNNDTNVRDVPKDPRLRTSTSASKSYDSRAGITLSPWYKPFRLDIPSNSLTPAYDPNTPLPTDGPTRSWNVYPYQEYVEAHPLLKYAQRQREECHPSLALALALVSTGTGNTSTSHTQRSVSTPEPTPPVRSRPCPLPGPPFPSVTVPRNRSRSRSPIRFHSPPDPLDPTISATSKPFDIGPEDTSRSLTRHEARKGSLGRPSYRSSSGSYARERTSHYASDGRAHHDRYATGHRAHHRDPPREEGRGRGGRRTDDGLGDEPLFMSGGTQITFHIVRYCGGSEYGRRLKRQILGNGGLTVRIEDATHVIFPARVDSLTPTETRLWSTLSANQVALSDEWIRDSITSGKQLPIHRYIVTLDRGAPTGSSSRTVLAWHREVPREEGIQHAEPTRLQEDRLEKTSPDPSAQQDFAKGPDRLFTAPIDTLQGGSQGGGPRIDENTEAITATLSLDDPFDDPYQEESAHSDACTHLESDEEGMALTQPQRNVPHTAPMFVSDWRSSTLHTPVLPTLASSLPPPSPLPTTGQVDRGHVPGRSRSFLTGIGKKRTYGGIDIPPQIDNVLDRLNGVAAPQKFDIPTRRLSHVLTLPQDLNPKRWKERRRATHPSGNVVRILQLGDQSGPQSCPSTFSMEEEAHGAQRTRVVSLADLFDGELSDIPVDEGRGLNAEEIASQEGRFTGQDYVTSTIKAQITFMADVGRDSKSDTSRSSSPDVPLSATILGRRRRASPTVSSRSSSPDVPLARLRRRHSLQVEVEQAEHPDGDGMDSSPSSSRSRDPPFGSHLGYKSLALDPNFTAHPRGEADDCRAPEQNKGEIATELATSATMGHTQTRRSSAAKATQTGEEGPPSNGQHTAKASSPPLLQHNVQIERVRGTLACPHPANKELYTIAHDSPAGHTGQKDHEKMQEEDNLESDSEDDFEVLDGPPLGWKNRP